MKVTTQNLIYGKWDVKTYQAAALFALTVKVMDKLMMKWNRKLLQLIKPDLAAPGGLQDTSPTIVTNPPYASPKLDWQLFWCKSFLWQVPWCNSLWTLLPKKGFWWTSKYLNLKFQILMKEPSLLFSTFLNFSLFKLCFSILL